MAKKTRPHHKKAKVFQHRYLLAAEVLLSMDLLLRVAKKALVQWDAIPKWVSVLIIMALVVGALGTLLLQSQRITSKGLDATHKVVNTLPIPTPYLLIHAIFFIALFYGYAWDLGVLNHIWPFRHQD